MLLKILKKSGIRLKNYFKRIVRYDKKQVELLAFLLPESRIINRVSFGTIFNVSVLLLSYHQK